MMKVLLNDIKSALIGALVGLVINWLWQNRMYLKICISAFFNFNKSYRISYAYLFRIKQNKDNTYLLIKGNRIDQYQPVGGVYKYYDSFSTLKEKLNIEDETNPSFYEEADLRIFVKGKNLVELLKWIETGKNRECDFKREFYEELIKPGYLSPELLFDYKFEFIKRVNRGINYSQEMGCKQILIFDIIDVTSNNKDSMEQLFNLSQNDKFILATSKDIDKGCIHLNGIDKKIGDHCKEIK